MFDEDKVFSAFQLVAKNQAEAFIASMKAFESTFPKDVPEEYKNNVMQEALNAYLSVYNDLMVNTINNMAEQYKDPAFVENMSAELDKVFCKENIPEGGLHE